MRFTSRSRWSRRGEEMSQEEIEATIGLSETAGENMEALHADIRQSRPDDYA